MLRYREIYVKLSVPSTSEEDAQQQAKDIVKAQLSHLKHDENRLPIRAQVSNIVGGTLMLDHPSLQEKTQ